LYEREARYIHRQVEQKIPLAQKRAERGGVISPCQRMGDESHSECLGFGPAALVRRADGDLRGRNADMAQQEGQNPLADAAEADYDDAAGIAEDFSFWFHCASSSRRRRVRSHLCL